MKKNKKRPPPPKKKDTSKMGLEKPASYKNINRNICRYWYSYFVRAVTSLHPLPPKKQ